jgi:hypothetical protein
MSGISLKTSYKDFYPAYFNDLDELKLGKNIAKHTEEHYQIQSASCRFQVTGCWFVSSFGLWSSVFRLPSSVFSLCIWPVFCVSL